jgi:hypothetical protein
VCEDFNKMRDGVDRRQEVGDLVMKRNCKESTVGVYCIWNWKFNICYGSSLCASSFLGFSLNTIGIISATKLISSNEHTYCIYYQEYMNTRHLQHREMKDSGQKKK